MVTRRPTPKLKVAAKTSAGNELYRTYQYPAASGLQPRRVDAPATVTELPSGAHLVLTCEGASIVVAPGFERIEPVYRAGCEGAARVEDPQV